MNNMAIYPELSNRKGTRPDKIKILNHMQEHPSYAQTHSSLGSFLHCDSHKANILTKELRAKSYLIATKVPQSFGSAKKIWQLELTKDKQKLLEIEYLI